MVVISNKRFFGGRGEGEKGRESESERGEGWSDGGMKRDRGCF